jgi:acyl-CoA thioesterase
MSDPNTEARRVVEHMMQHDRFSQWLGIELLDIKTGESCIRMKVGDTLTATAKEEHNGRSTGLYTIRIVNQDEKLVAQFKGLCYRTDKKLI